jgi:WNK lysine deficient protein kinase
MSVDSPMNISLASAGRRGSITNMEQYRTSESYDSEGSNFKDYSSDCSVEEFISDVAALVNRPAEKAHEWLVKLKSEDILTVGDLRNLLEEDWQRLNLTVFATRVIRNALRGKGKPIGLDLMSPRVSGKIPDSAGSGM